MTAVLLAASDPIAHVADRTLFHSGWLVVTNHMVMLVLAALLMLIVFPLITRPYREGWLVPTGTRNLFEAILMYLREDVVRPVLGDDTDRFIPFIWTLFFFILFNNLLGLLPLEALTGLIFAGHGFGGTATANIYVTATLAIVAFLVIQVSGIRANGPVKYLSHFLGGAPIYMAPVMVVVEFIGMLVKPFALCIRLFANMSAGHIMLAVLVGFVAAAASAMGTAGGIAVGIPVVLGSTAIMCLELFVAFLQAYIFAFLTSLFIGQLVVHEHEEHHEEGAHHGEGHPAVKAAH